MFASLFNFSVFILRHFIKTGTPQSTPHLSLLIGFNNQKDIFYYFEIKLPICSANNL